MIRAGGSRRLGARLARSRLAWAVVTAALVLPLAAAWAWPAIRDNVTKVSRSAARGSVGSVNVPAARSSLRSASAPAAGRHAATVTGPTPNRSVGSVSRPAAQGATTSGGVRAVAAADSPPGFWYGSDSFTMPVAGSGPYQEPVLGGNYGGYVGMAGNWAHWQGCGGKLVWSATNAGQAAANLMTYHKGVGVAAYWFMGGPGVDPNYDGTVAEAQRWGQSQAAQALADLNSTVKYPVLWMDVELPGNAPDFTPAPDNGWNNVYTSPCSGRVKTRRIAPGIDRGVIDGFASYLTAHSSYKPGVYSAPPAWTAIFGTGSASKIPGLYEWTYTAGTNSVVHHPSAWCLKSTSTCAHFFGGQHSSDNTALMWQWSGGGGTSNGYGDFDQIDGTRTP